MGEYLNANDGIYRVMEVRQRGANFSVVLLDIGRVAIDEELRQSLVSRVKGGKVLLDQRMHVPAQTVLRGGLDPLTDINFPGIDRAHWRWFRITTNSEYKMTGMSLLRRVVTLEDLMNDLGAFSSHIASTEPDRVALRMIEPQVDLKPIQLSPFPPETVQPELRVAPGDIDATIHMVVSPAPSVELAEAS